MSDKDTSAMTTEQGVVFVVSRKHGVVRVTVAEERADGSTTGISAVMTDEEATRWADNLRIAGRAEWKKGPHPEG